MCRRRDGAIKKAFARVAHPSMVFTLVLAEICLRPSKPTRQGGSEKDDRVARVGRCNAWRAHVRRTEEGGAGVAAGDGGNGRHHQVLDEGPGDDDGERQPYSPLNVRHDVGNPKRCVSFCGATLSNFGVSCSLVTCQNSFDCGVVTALGRSTSARNILDHVCNFLSLGVIFNFVGAPSECDHQFFNCQSTGVEGLLEGDVLELVGLFVVDENVLTGMQARSERTQYSKQNKRCPWPARTMYCGGSCFVRSQT